MVDYNLIIGKRTWKSHITQSKHNHWNWWRVLLFLCFLLTLSFFRFDGVLWFFFLDRFICMDQLCCCFFFCPAMVLYLSVNLLDHCVWIDIFLVLIFETSFFLHVFRWSTFALLYWLTRRIALFILELFFWKLWRQISFSLELGRLFIRLYVWLSFASSFIFDFSLALFFLIQIFFRLSLRLWNFFLLGDLFETLLSTGIFLVNFMV